MILAPIRPNRAADGVEVGEGEGEEEEEEEVAADGAQQKTFRLAPSRFWTRKTAVRTGSCTRQRKRGRPGLLATPARRRHWYLPLWMCLFYCTTTRTSYVL